VSGGGTVQRRRSVPRDTPTGLVTPARAALAPVSRTTCTSATPHRASAVPGQAARQAVVARRLTRTPGGLVDPPVPRAHTVRRDREEHDDPAVPAPSGARPPVAQLIAATDPTPRRAGAADLRVVVVPSSIRQESAGGLRHDRLSVHHREGVERARRGAGRQGHRVGSPSASVM
jgi:hypothetical protein